jgi:hypothetical protein
MIKLKKMSEKSEKPGKSTQYLGIRPMKNTGCTALLIRKKEHIKLRDEPLGGLPGSRCRR